jgi:Protein of unknown function (DUF3500)
MSKIQANGRRVVAARMAEAAAGLLGALTEDQRRLAQWPFPSDEERRLWYYTPTDHGGMALGDLRPAGQRRTLQLVATGLSRPGYATVATIMGLENILDEVEGWTAMFDRERGRDPGRYYVRVFGQPESGTWAWRFGGHHVSINHLVLDGEVCASTPCFLGADPASTTLLGPHLLRPLAGVEDLARELVRSLDPQQEALALISSVAPVDIVGGNRSRLAEGAVPLPLPEVWRGRFDGELGDRLRSAQEQAERAVGLRPEHLEALRLTSTPKGVPATSLRTQQQDLLRRLLGLYVGRLPDELAEAEAAKVNGSRLDELSFAWAGSVVPDEPHYYRVQGSELLVEYDNTQRGVNHVHSVWRDLRGDFGDDVLLQHYRTSHPSGVDQGASE